MKNNILKKFNKFFSTIILVISAIILFSCKNKLPDNVIRNSNNYESSISTVEKTSDTTEKISNGKDTEVAEIDIDGRYTDKDNVALYIKTYKKLPRNFITKKEARKLGWDTSKNNLKDVMGDKSIGGDVFKNYEKILPVIDGRTYYECDIDFNGKKRNAKRIIYADDFDEDIGYIYYTEDHYKTFVKLY